MRSDVAPLMVTKTADALCPNCGSKCAEFRSIHDDRMRWTCHCGASGFLDGVASAPKAKQPTVHKHWSNKG